jgi:FAD dependent oxidoreductase TIGR03364
MNRHPDLLIVGAGIVGLAHAWAAVQRGWRVTVVERDRRCVGASVRNFGLVCVTGQSAGDTWRRARASRAVWATLAPQIGVPIAHEGLWLAAHRPEAAAVLQAFAAGPMGEGCTLLTPAQAAQQAPALRTAGLQAVLHSPHELRLDSRQAVPRLAAWLAERHGVQFVFGDTVVQVQAPRVHTASGRVLQAPRVLLCPGTELHGVGHALLAPHRLQLSQLQMLRLRPPAGFRLGGAVMGDLSLVRYGGFAALPEAQALRQRLQHDEPASLAAGIHLIVVQNTDGTLVVGDSHRTVDSAEPFGNEAIDALLRRHLQQALALPDDPAACPVLQRWTGVYPTGAHADCLIEAPDDATRLVLVTSGTGASTAFGIAQEVLAGW